MRVKLPHDWTLSGLWAQKAPRRETQGGSSFAQALTFAGALEKVGRFGAHPRQKTRHPGVRAQGVGSLVVPRQFGLGEQGVDLTVADTMQPHCLHAAARFGHEVMSIALRGRDGPATQGAQRVRCWRGGGRLTCSTSLFALDASLHVG